MTNETRVFRSIQRVYFDDLDALNILHNVRYLIFIERARGELFNELGSRWNDAENEDKWHVVAAHEIRYLAPFRGTGQVAIELEIKHLGGSSMVLHARVISVDNAVVYAEGDTRLVRIEETTGRPCSWSESWRSAIAARQR
jgi:acyl-CoA thioester hydrolase